MERLAHLQQKIIPTWDFFHRPPLAFPLVSPSIPSLLLADGSASPSWLCVVIIKSFHKFENAKKKNNFLIMQLLSQIILSMYILNKCRYEGKMKSRYLLTRDKIKPLLTLIRYCFALPSYYVTYVTNPQRQKRSSSAPCSISYRIQSFCFVVQIK